ncbi:MAG: AAA family ATPase [Eubacteriales bacterium]
MKSSEKTQKEMTAPTPSIGVDGEQSNQMNNLSLPQTKEERKGELSDFPQLPHEKHFKMHRMSDIVSETVEWLWYPYIPKGKITIIQGDPGEGKTYLILGIASLLTRGEPLFRAEKQEPINVIYQTAEDGLADTIKPRLESLGADCRKILVVDESETPLSLCDQRIKESILKTKAKLLILDPLQAYLGAGVDMHRANEVRPVFQKLATVAQETGCAIVLIGHMNKGGAKGAYRGLGSVDILAAARSVLLVARSPEEENVRIIAHIKSNLAPDGSSLAFTYENGLRFLGESFLSVDELLGYEKTKRNPREKAKEFLLDILSENRVEALNIIKRSEKLNIGERTLKTAKKELGILSEKVGNTWFWSLP